MGRTLLRSTRPHHLLPFTVMLLAALGWTGLRARRAADAQAPPRPPGARPSPASTLHLEPAVLELGRLEPDTSRPLEVAWRLEGDAACRVLGVDASCGCVVAEGLPTVLHPGDAGTLRLDVHAARRPGPLRAALRIWLDPAPGPRPTTLVVRGHVGSRVGVRPEVLDLGPRTAGTPVERRLEIAVARELAGTPVRARLVGLEGAALVEPSAFAGRRGSSLRVRVRAPAAPGPFSGRVVVQVGQEPDAIAIPVRGIARLRR